MPDSLPDLDGLRLFLKIVEAGSVAAAADAIRMPRTTARRKLKELEAQFGAGLLHKTADGVVPTPSGEALAERSVELLARAAALVDQVRADAESLTGPLRVCLPTGMPMAFVAQHLAVFAQQHPELEFRLRVSEDPPSALPLDADFAISFGEAPALGPTIISAALRPTIMLLATQAYLDAKGTPETVADLTGHRLMVWERDGTPLRLRDEEGGEVDSRPWARSNDVHLLRELARKDEGIAVVPDAGFFVEEDRLLVPVLQHVAQGEIPIWFMIPQATMRSLRVQAILALARDLVVTPEQRD